MTTGKEMLNVCSRCDRGPERTKFLFRVREFIESD